jgi:hypothetical protein
MCTDTLRAAEIVPADLCAATALMSFERRAQNQEKLSTSE